MIPQPILDAPVWCVSKQKVPLDMHVLPKGMEWGVSTRRSHSCYVGFDAADAMSKKTGYATTMWVDSASQGIYMVDIEKECPAALRRAILLSLHDHTLHVERSASGKGYHILVQLEQAAELRNAKYKKWFEILTSHHCILTGAAITSAEAYADVTPENHTEGDEEAELLGLMSKPIRPMELYDAVGGGRPQAKPVDSEGLGDYREAVKGFGPEHADLFNLLCDLDYQKDVDTDFNGDLSRYEYGYISKLHYHLQRCAADMMDAQANRYSVKLSKHEAVMLVYMAAKQSLPPRDKHGTYRNGLPWLLYTSERIYVRTFEDGG